MDILIQQAPANITIEEIEKIYIKNDKNVINTLAELWEIVDNKVIPPKTKWDDIRETCDAYDFEMEKVMKKMKNKINK
jgi:hypothetical protein